MANISSQFLRACTRPDGWLAVLSCVLFVLGLFANARFPALKWLSPTAIEQGAAALSLKVVLESAPGQTTVPAVRVRVFTGLDDGTWSLVRTADATAGGTSVIPNLPSGLAWVVVDAAGYARQAFRTVLYGTEVHQARLVAASALQVSVSDEDGGPLRDATVLVREEGQLPFGALTNEHGEVVLTQLPPGPHRVEVFARGYEAGVRTGAEATVKLALARLGALQVQVRNPDHSPAVQAEVWIVGSSLWPARAIRTNEQGEAAIAGIGAGTFDLRASSGALVSTTAASIRLERGEVRKLMLDLYPGRFIAVDVFGVRAEQREAIAGARVVLAEQGVSSFPLTGVTARNGRITLGPVSRAASYVSARAPGFISRGVVPIGNETQQSVTVELVEGGTLHGTVVDDLGYPIGGALIEVVGFDLDGQPVAETPLLAAYREANFDASLQPLAVLPAGELGVTVGPVPFVTPGRPSTGAVPKPSAFDMLPADYEPWISGFEGRYRASPVPPGRVRVRVHHPTYTDALSDPVTLGPGGSAELNIVMSAGAAIDGRVVDERGLPVAGARVFAAATQGSYERSTTSREDGGFSLDAVPSRITIALARPSDRTRFVSRETLVTKSGETLSREFALPAEREGVEWQVVNAEGAAVELAQVSLMSLDPSVPLRTTQFSDTLGSVRFPDVLGLRVRVSIQASGLISRSEQFDHAPAERTFSLVKGVWVTGTVTAVRGRLPAAGARVTLQSGESRNTTYTSALGEYEFRGVAPGKVRVRAEHDEYAAGQLTVAVEAPNREDRAFEMPTLDLAEAVSLSGVVVDADGRAVAGARVALEFLGAYVPRGAEPAGVVRTNAEGGFTLTGVASGNITVFAMAAGRGRGELKVSVDAGRDVTDLELKLDASGAAELVGPSGVAVTLGVRDADNRLWVVHVAPNSEAERGGLNTGDEILSLDGEHVTSLSDARERLSGQPGTDIVIRVARRGATHDFRVRREDLASAR